jgi:hypothetical protein
MKRKCQRRIWSGLDQFIQGHARIFGWWGCIPWFLEKGKENKLIYWQFRLGLSTLIKEEFFSISPVAIVCGGLVVAKNICVQAR